MRRSGLVNLSLLVAGSVCLALVTTSVPAAAANASKPKMYNACACDYAGASVAISGTTAVFGVPGFNDAAGRAFVYKNTGGTWTRTAELIGSDVGPGEIFGASVSISGTAVIVGAPGHAGYAGSAYVFTLVGSTWSQTAELHASDASAGAWFGASVAVDGGTAVVGAPATAGNTGDAYVFTQTGSAWPQTAELTGSASNSYFGYAVAVSGTSTIVGAPGIPNNQGNAYVFTLTGGSWTQAAALVGSGGGAHDFGAAVAINGATAVVGAWMHKGGAAYVFTQAGGVWSQAAQVFASDNRVGFGAAVATTGSSVAVSAVGSSGNGGRVYIYDVVGGSWTQTAEFVHLGPEAGDFFGNRAVAMSGTTLIAGAPAHGAPGDAFVFTVSGGTWTQAADLTASDGNAHDNTGTSVAVSSASVVAGAPGHLGMGRAYLFPTPPPWHPVIGLQAPDTVAGDNLGASLSMTGTIVIAGAPGHAGGGTAYIFTQTINAPYTQAAVRAPANNFVYQQPAKLSGSDTTAGDNFGASVAISGTTAVVGAPGHAGGGAAYVFTQTGSTWTQAAELRGSDTAAGDTFGASVSVSGTTVVVGAPAHAGGGRSYVFSAPGASWAQDAELQASDTASGDTFGASVAISGTNLVVGAPGHAGGGRSYVFSEPGSVWAQAAELQGSDTALGDNFGASVAISGTSALIGGPGHTAGRAYVFGEVGSAWPQSTELVGLRTVTGDAFGSAVAISGTTAVVGAPNHSTGIAFVYSGV